MYVYVCPTWCVFPGPLSQTPWDAACDVWWDEAMEGVCDESEPEWLDAEDPLFILYTSGSTGKPKVRCVTLPPKGSEE